MTTSHARVADQAAIELLATPAGRRIFDHTTAWLQNPDNATLRDILGQPFRGWTPGQVEALSQLLHYGRTGRYELAYFEVEATPGRDADRTGNQAKLANLPDGITAELVDGNGFDGDAMLTIPEGLTVLDDAEPDRPARDADAWENIPLEIGHTDASRTLMHLMQYGAVARWPYGFTRIYVLFTTPRWSLSRTAADALTT
ncbi:hypothetical protein ABZ671_18685 [Micromonospora sp. NPDC006766]|uniref:hypothetical protein n=1 Tax=Micromonospora sp. NPDC006766 TaxID=3154778 RepID=UPI0034018806